MIKEEKSSFEVGIKGGPNLNRDILSFIDKYVKEHTFQLLERLAESDSIEHYEGIAGYLLFTTQSAIFPFVKFEEQLSEINDYCLYLLTCLRVKVKEFEPFAIERDDWDAPES